ncbi:MAG: hypothetical protein KDE22_08995 [Rhodobacterales bacterium]|nr:hypothetical protein [Rhodobacterales bacterium]
MTARPRLSPAGPRLPALVLALILALAILAPVPAAADDGDLLPDARRRVEDSMQRLLRSLDLMLLAIPQYEAPEILDNGDIIIRRKRPGGRDRRDGPFNGPRDDGGQEAPFRT